MENREGPRADSREGMGQREGEGERRGRRERGRRRKGDLFKHVFTTNLGFS